MRELSIDIETYSSIDLTKSGVYAYSSAPDFRILLFAYAYDDEEVKIYDPEAEGLPPSVLERQRPRQTQPVYQFPVHWFRIPPFLRAVWIPIDIPPASLSHSPATILRCSPNRRISVKCAEGNISA